MIQKLKLAILSLSYMFVALVPVTLATTTSVSAANISGNLCHGADQLDVTTNEAGGCVLSGDTCDANCVIRKAVNILSVVVGVVAVIMIIVAGFRYITSGGKDESVKTAKNTILYAVIGLIVVALAQVIVRFVLSKSTSS